MNTPGVITNVAGTQSIEAFTQALIDTLPSGFIYDKKSKDTILYKLYTALAQELVKSDIILESVGNNNYLSVSVTDELVIRGSLTRDRLANENAFELDGLRFSSSAARVFQNAFLNEGNTEIQLFFTPLIAEDGSIDIQVFNTGIVVAPVDFPVTFDSTTNKVTITASKSGAFTLGYIDTGDVIRLTENITVPVGLFRLGFSDGGWNELGFGE